MKRDNWVPKEVEEYQKYLISLHKKREQIKLQNKKTKEKRKPFTSKERKQILEKTGGKCHICGGDIQKVWHADHVFAYSNGGDNNIDNYLAAHPICNNYKWDYLPQEFQEILRSGVWIKTQIERGTKLGKLAAKEFIQYEKNRINRRKNNHKH